MSSTIKVSLRDDVLSRGYFDGLTTNITIRSTGVGAVDMSLAIEANKIYTHYLGILTREFQGIEARLNQIVANALSLTSESDRRYFVRSTVVASNMLSLDAKKRIPVAWAGHKNIFASKSKTKFEKQLSDLVTHRNAIVHGEPVVMANTGDIFLEYFKGDKKSQLFDEPFIRKVLKNLSDLRRDLDTYSKAEEVNRLAVASVASMHRSGIEVG